MFASARMPSPTKLPNEPPPIPAFLSSPSSFPITTSSARTFATYGSSILSTEGSSGMVELISVSLTRGLTSLASPAPAAEAFLSLAAGLTEGVALHGSMALLCCAGAPCAQSTSKQSERGRTASVRPSEKLCVFDIDLRDQLQ